MFIKSTMKWETIKDLSDNKGQGVLSADKTYFYWRGYEAIKGKLEQVLYRIHRQSKFVEIWKD